MRKILTIILILTLLLTLCACSKNEKPQYDEVSDKSEAFDDYGGEQLGCFAGTVIEVSENALLIEPDAESNEAKCADRISVSLNNISAEVKAGDRVAISYKGGIAESYPAQINDVLSVDVVFDWGLTLSVENVTPSGLTVVCTQSGGEADGELLTGSYYIVEMYTPEGWEECPYVIDGDIGWDSIGYLINMDGRTEFPENWSWLYGSLETGTYRIGKDFLNSREPGDYDECMLYAEFEITE